MTRLGGGGGGGGGGTAKIAGLWLKRQSVPHILAKIAVPSACTDIFARISGDDIGKSGRTPNNATAFVENARKLSFLFV